ncbi:uncharacterized protein LOC114880170 [Osmia bicornis bicornis]|uniref:uncharacterized protein LOC114880170 n=1 Tax=Osmia bicornis bicornis TaxID=1437191 RepID=UPI0010F6E498|nr:uncharacterized protein LOC114880170 [Osmia bicornis bicornis]
MMLLISFMMIALAMGEPGLLRVPKVYNAVITSNQNLSPSRAFPVIQPIIHRTAVGYVPPYYYTQVSPQFAGPDVVHLSQGPLKPGNEGDVRSEPSATVESSQIADTKVKTETDQGGEENKDRPRGGSKNKKEEEPLSFYPNYQSLYYDPYFYTYNGFNPHVVPGTYYVDYQPFGTVQPIPASTPKNGLSQHLLPGYHEEKKPVAAAKELKEMIPDVPPPPLPTAVPKSS